MQETIFLFDVDGTLTPSREKVSREMREFLQEVRSRVKIGFVGGSDLEKQKEQLGDDCTELFDFCFPENGLTFIKNGKKISSESYLNFIGEKTHGRLVREVMREFSALPEEEVPKMRGNFLELRTSMVNISPVGRTCSREERREFKALDEKNKTREGIAGRLREKFPGLTFSIGGEISIDIFPVGWDKTYSIRHLHEEGIKRIYFFGDMTSPGGNDFEIFSDERVNGCTVTSPEDTIQKVKELLKTLE
ncbi:phosphomannomutase [Nematocida major]|uniref:phosphomannomutase n=1 Tax=Nematocida major TaxID=1912982 RepID=UPI0020084D00|nr:phosphomannomutase [Nematocida major]KAH9387387.1 phosphomannomutase [Nematocida major]